MHKAGFPGWRVAIDEPVDLHQLLFIRDACGLALDEFADPGQLTVAVPDLSHLVDAADRHTLLGVWQQRWRESLRGRVDPEQSSTEDTRPLAIRHGGRFLTLDGDQGLHHLQATTFDAFRTWWSRPLGEDERPGWGPAIGGIQGDLIRLHLGKPVLHEVVTELERVSGRELHFDLSIETLAVSRPEVLARAPGYVLLAASVMADDDRYRAWLREEFAAM